MGMKIGNNGQRAALFQIPHHFNHAAFALFEHRGSRCLHCGNIMGVEIGVGHTPIQRAHRKSEADQLGAGGVVIAKMGGDQQNRPPGGLGSPQSVKPRTRNFSSTGPFPERVTSIKFNNGPANVVTYLIAQGLHIVGFQLGADLIQIVADALFNAQNRGQPLHDSPHKP